MRGKFLASAENPNAKTNISCGREHHRTKNRRQRKNGPELDLVAAAKKTPVVEKIETDRPGQQKIQTKHKNIS
jgi:hypothetical protein